MGWNQDRTAHVTGAVPGRRGGIGLRANAGTKVADSANAVALDRMIEVVRANQAPVDQARTVRTDEGLAAELPTSAGQLRRLWLRSTSAWCQKRKASNPSPGKLR